MQGVPECAAAEKGPQELFQRETQLAATAARPFPHVLLVRKENQLLLALPCPETFELRTLAGELAAEHPIGPDAAHPITFGRPFARWLVDPPQAAPPEALEMRISRVVAYKPDLPEGMLPEEPQPPLRRWGTPRQARDAVDMPPEAWPWFPLRTDGSATERALYAQDTTADATALVRVRKAETGPGADPDDLRLGPSRRYPGRVLTTPGRPPDFNGDGWADLVLWDAARPSPSLSALTRAATARTWPVRVAIHTFEPGTGRFAGRPMAHIELRGPLAWFLLDPVPLHLVVMTDVNGDGRSDFACATQRDTYAVWISTDQGFDAEPDFQRRFRESLESVAWQASLDGRARTSIALQSQNVLWVLKAVRPQP